MKNSSSGQEHAPIGQPGAPHVADGLAGDVAGVSRVVLVGDRVVDVADHRQRRLRRERVDQRRLGLGHDQQVGLVDGPPADDARAVEGDALLEGLLGEGVGRDREVLPDAGKVHEPEVHRGDFSLPDLGQDFFGSHAGSLLGVVSEARRRRTLLGRVSPKLTMIAGLGRVIHHDGGAGKRAVRGPRASLERRPLGLHARGRRASAHLGDRRADRAGNRAARAGLARSSPGLPRPTRGQSRGAGGRSGGSTRGRTASWSGRMPGSGWRSTGLNWSAR